MNLPPTPADDPIAPREPASAERGDTGPLAGLLVADFTRVLAGPYATMMLADLGADVVKVERPGSGDDTRAWGPPYAGDGQSSYFHSVNRNKTSLALDLSDPGDLSVAQGLAGRADVVVENFRVGSLGQRGLGYADVAAVNPRVVYCSITGFGSKAGAELPGYDLLVQAMGGLMSITGPEGGPPTKVGVAVVDVLTGLHATIGILAALRHRDATGVGQHVEVNLLSSLLSALVNQSSAYVTAGVTPGILGNAHPSIAPYEVLPTADRPLVLAVGNDRQFRALVEVLGVPELADDESFSTNPSRVANRLALVAHLTAALSGDSAAQWQAQLTARGVPCGPINDVAEAFALAQRLGLAPVATIDNPSGQHHTPTVAHPISLSVTPATYRSAPPKVGENPTSPA